MAEADPTVALAESLAANLRYQRQRRNLTQSQLARLCGIPRSTITHIESGACNPTLSVLARLGQALQLSLEELLSAPSARCEVFRRGALPVLRKGRSGTALVQKLLPHRVPGMEIDRIELQPGDRFAGAPHRPGTHEYLACERGAMCVWVAGERFDLEPGDVATFPGDQAHSYQNDGRELAVGFSVVALPPGLARGAG